MAGKMEIIGKMEIMVMVTNLYVSFAGSQNSEPFILVFGTSGCATYTYMLWWYVHAMVVVRGTGSWQIQSMLWYLW